MKKRSQNVGLLFTLLRVTRPTVGIASPYSMISERWDTRRLYESMNPAFSYCLLVQIHLRNFKGG